MSLLRHFVTNIDLLKLQRPASILSRQISGLNRTCVSCHHQHVLDQSRIFPSTFLNLTSWRGFSSRDTLHNGQTGVRKWTYKLDPFGKLVLSSSSIYCHVSPIDPNEYPEQDLVVVSQYGTEEDVVSCENLGDDVHVSQTGDAEAAYLDIKVPIKYGKNLMC